IAPRHAPHHSARADSSQARSGQSLKAARQCSGRSRSLDRRRALSRRPDQTNGRGTGSCEGGSLNPSQFSRNMKWSATFFVRGFTFSHSRVTLSLSNWFADLIAQNGVHDLDSETTERRAHSTISPCPSTTTPSRKSSTTPQTHIRSRPKIG